MASVRKVYVSTPKGQIVQAQYKNSRVKMELRWNEGFSARMNRNFQDVQAYVDNAVIRYMTPYTPMRTGILYKSAILGTTIGSGQIVQVAPYARYLYYGKLMVSSITGSPFALQGESKVLTEIPLKYDTFRHPLAGAYWFERAKADKKDVILRGAKRILNR